MTRLCMMLGAVALLAGCNRAPPTPQATAWEAAVNSGKVTLTATAPDGTKLWAVLPPGQEREVYFSSRGTDSAHTENCGKGCVRTVLDRVPGQ